ncbi:MAG: lipid A biosynthesis acyltransferase [Prosthecochloris sp.]|uniref:lysophospholipid acyltransferase family protein n=1 Tax=Prosthecochloris sp. TaxID=290513 RepID=UPI0013C95695|nr:lysophospholipid acyltransferase family protein [Prosthecochloris sp.]NEX12731.1 lipid A biosynthesis acyltransferase [Prosthecochloris sp.]
MASGKTLQQRIQERSVFLLFSFLGTVTRMLSRDFFERLACVIGDIVYDVLRIRRSLVERNLSQTFPLKSAREISVIARKVYRNVVISLLEVFRIPMIDGRNGAEKLIDADLDEFLSATRDQGRGGVIISAHFGNWELTGVCVGLLGAPMTIVVKRLRNALIDREINALRSFHGNSVVYKKQALREGLRLLQGGGYITMLADQSDPKGGFVMPFLGRPASVFLGPAFLALKAGVPVFLGMTRRQESGRYLLEAREIPTSDLSFGKAGIQELARRYTEAIEEYIYRYPEEWFWLHDRWKRHSA